jgi:bifunctional non-homologous end joining protein LigD
MVRLEDFKPMLLSERALGLHEPGWVYELKYDGYRVTAAFGGGRAVQLRTRHGANATHWFPEISDALAGMAGVAGDSCIADGEVCVLDDEGRSDFQALQERARHRCWYIGAKPVDYCVFDLLVDHGVDITAEPLMLRKAALGRLFREPPWGILVVPYFEKGDAPLLRQAAGSLVQELIAKRRSSIYLPDVRTTDWVRIKCKPKEKGPASSGRR